MAMDHIIRVHLQNFDYFCHISTTEGAAAKGHMLLESTTHSTSTSVVIKNCHVINSPLSPVAAF